MFPETPLLQLVPARVQATLNRMKAAIWLPAQDLPVAWTGASREHCTLEQAQQKKLTPLEAADVPFFWGNLEDQSWFHVLIPQAFRDGTWFLEWKEQGEATAYINGIPYAGLDVAHPQCPIPEGCSEIWIEAMALETGIWIPGYQGRGAITPEGCRFEAVRVRQRDNLSWKVLLDFEVLADLLENEYRRQPSLRTPFGRAIGYCDPLEGVSVLYRRLVRFLDEVICAYEREGLSAAKRELERVYAALRGQTQPIHCRLTGHAHIDLVWLWTEKAGEFKAVHTFATMNRLLRKYPDLRFGYSQPASYRAVQKRSPQLMQNVRQHIAEGTWEPVGAAEVECDTQLACGEALVRCLLLGQEGFRDLQGKPSEIMWLPDVFGYTACLPQILVETGVRYFFTTKLHWGSVTLFPYSSFIWEAPDGTRLLSHVSQGMGYNMNVLPSEIRDAAEEYRQADVHGEFLMCCGYGDGGGGVTEEMCERAQRVADLSGTPSAAWGRIDGFFSGLEEVRERLPVYRGELYLQYHRGVHTTHGNLKAAYRRAERALQRLEAVRASLGLGPAEDALWQRLVFAQFHDYLPGSSIAPVYSEAVPELEALSLSCEEDSLRLLEQSSGENLECLFNPLPVEQVVNYQGEFLEIGPLCGAVASSLPRRSLGAVQAHANALSNDHVRVRFTADGRIQEFVVGGQEVALAAPLGGLVRYHDLPHAFEAWELDRSTLANAETIECGSFVEATTDGKSGSVTFRVAISEKSSVVIHYRLSAADRVLEVEYAVVWNDPDYLLKVQFPTQYSGAHARFGAPFGSMLRSQQPGQAFDEAQWEVPGSRWAVISDDGEREGFFVVTESKYGWSARQGVLGLSLLRSARLPAYGSGAVGIPNAPCSDLGGHRIRIVLGRFDTNSPSNELPAQIAETYFQPVFSYKGTPMEAGLLGLDNASSLVPSWAQPVDKSTWILRLHETLGRRGQAMLRLRSGWEFERINLSGKPIAQKFADGIIHYKPYELISLKLSRETAKS